MHRPTHLFTGLPGLCLAALALLGGVTGCEKRSLPPVISASASPPVQRVVIYLPLQKELTYRISNAASAASDSSWKLALPVDFDAEVRAVNANLLRFLKSANADDTLVVPLYAPDLQEILRKSYEEELRKYDRLDRLEDCREDYTQDYFSNELKNIPQEKDWYLDWDGKLPERFERLFDRFHCQQGTRPLTRFQLRRAFVMNGIYYQKRADRQARTWFARARALGANPVKNPIDEGLLPDERDVKTQQGLWVAYSQAVNEFERREKRIPISFRDEGFPAQIIYVDGDPFEVGELERKPLLLFPGLHFIQFEDPLGRIRSDTFEVTERESRLGIDLGKNGFLTPTNAEVEQILWLNLLRRIHSLPEWLSRGLQDYTKSMAERPVELYVAASWEGWDRDAEGELYLGSFDSIRGLVDVASRNRGKDYHTLAPAREPPTKVRAPDRWSVGAGIAQVETEVFGVIEADWIFRRSDSLNARAGVTLFHHGARLETFLPMAGVWAGVLHEPVRNDLGLLYGASLGVMVPGFAPADGSRERQILMRAYPRAHFGLGFPIGKFSSRLEVIASPMFGLDALQTGLGPAELMLEGRLSFRRWSLVPVPPARQDQELNP